MNDERTRVALLVGGGSCIPWVTEVLDPEKIKLVAGYSHKKKADGLSWFRDQGISHAILPYIQMTKGAGNSREVYMNQIKDLVKFVNPDLVIALGWDLILPESLIADWEAAGILSVNLHPALVSEDGSDVVVKGYQPIPVIKGEVSYVIKRVLELKLPITGACIHRLTPIVDQGTVTRQGIVKVFKDDTPEPLEKRVHELEKKLVQGFIRDIQNLGLKEALKTKSN